jgi:hypothetical protein
LRRDFRRIVFESCTVVIAVDVTHAYAQLERAWMHIALGHDDSAHIDLDAAEGALHSMRAGGHPRWADLQSARALLALRRDDTAAARIHASASALDVPCLRWLRAAVKPTATGRH